MAKIVIVGGGIGGLAGALSISGKGHQVTVLERADRFAEIGAGIQLAPNGIHALDRLGVGEAVRRSGNHIEELRFMDGTTGEHVVSMPLHGEYQRRFGNPYVVVHRGDMHRLLLDACRATPSITLRSSCPAASYDQDGSTATVTLDTGERVTGDAVVGADGLHSALRRHMVADGEPRVSGITVYRTIVPMEEVPEDLRWNSVTWWTGPKCHFVHYPIGGGRYLNLAASNDNGVTTAFSGIPVESAHVHREMASLTAARRLLDLGRAWKSWVLVDRDPIDNWTDGRVTLLGDAAHPMLHYAAQGACMGLEDAVLLGDLLDCSANEFGAQFEQYNALRRERTARVQLIARESIQLWHPAGEAAVARNRILSGMSATDLHDYVAWMHGARDFSTVGGHRPESGAAR